MIGTILEEWRSRRTEARLRSEGYLGAERAAEARGDNAGVAAERRKRQEAQWEILDPNEAIPRLMVGIPFREGRSGLR